MNCLFDDVLPKLSSLNCFCNQMTAEQADKGCERTIRWTSPDLRIEWHSRDDHQSDNKPSSHSWQDNRGIPQPDDTQRRAPSTGLQLQPQWYLSNDQLLSISCLMLLIGTC